MNKLAFALFLVIPSLAFSESLLVTNVTVHTQTEQGTIARANVLVEGDRIAAISSETVAADVDETIDGTGLVMTPGLFSAYSQIGLDEIPLEVTTVDSRLNPEVPNIGPAFDIQYAYNPASTVVDVNLAEGVTHGVVAPRSGPDVVAGLGALVGFHTTGVTQAKVAMFSDIGAVAANTAGGSKAAALGKLHYTLAQLSSFRPRTYNAGLGEYSRRDLIALKEHIDSRAPFVVRAHRAVDIRRLLELAEAYDLNLVVRGGAEAWQMAAELAERDVPVILDPLANLPISFEQLGARLDNAALLANAGVRIAIITNQSNNNRAIRQHAGNAVAHGLAWADGLYAITRAAADIYGLSGPLGRLEVGGPATFVLWNGDPLELSTWAQKVVVEGELVDQTTRQTQLFERYKSLDRKPYEYGYRR